MAKRNPYAALVEAGIPPSEAEESLRMVQDKLRGGEDDGTPFSAGAMQLMADPQPEDVEDARADWYSSRAVPRWAKRLLDAREM